MMKQLKKIHNLSIRTKLTLCLLVTSLASTALVGGLAYKRLTHKFDSIVMQNSTKRFSDDVSAYINAYGSWDNAQKNESFRSFNERRMVTLGIRPPHRGQLLDGDVIEYRKVPNIAIPPLPADIKSRPVSNMHRPPFRFYLFDAKYKALMSLAPYKKGDLVKPNIKSKLIPIEIDDHTVAYFSPQGKVNYSDLDLGYLAAMREALIYGVAAAMLLTLILGVLFGNQLSAALRKLTAAAQAMADGKLQQFIEIEAKDEVGILAQTFNHMSEQLVKNHQELKASYTQIHKQAQELRELSQRDALTHLHNRRYFDEQSDLLHQQAAKYKRPFSVMIGDIDHFKKINDTFSHAIGDEVLIQIGQILNSKVRASDLVARYGGEEFVIAFPDTYIEQAQATCEALRSRIENYPWYQTHPDLKVTMSMGLNDDIKVENIHDMLKAADQLLYQAKNNGRNRVCVTPL
jgi:two-component system, cell cycle response regulator